MLARPPLDHQPLPMDSENKPTEPPSPAPAPVPESKTGNKTRLATFLFPPLGLILLMAGRPSLGKFLGGLIFIGLYAIVYTVALVFILIKAEILHPEFGGSGLPHLTRHPARTDFDSLEKHRNAQTKPATTNRNGGTYWTGFRGPRNDGHYTEQPLELNWDQTPPKLLWNQPIGGGYSSFAIAKGIAYTIEQRRNNEALVAYDINDGTELWSNVWKGKFVESEGMGGIGPRSTPTWHDGRVFALGALGEFRCVDAITGDTIWRRHALNDAMSTQLQFASTASPVIVDDKVLVLTGMPAGKSGRGLIAYQVSNGEPAWQAIEEKVAYSTPLLTSLLGTSQLLVFTGFRFVGLNPEDGSELWSHPWNVSYDNSIAQPLVLTGNRVFISAGYGKGCALLEISGSEANWSVEQVWKTTFMKNKFSSSVVHDGYIYGLDNNILVCLDPETGRKKWKDGRYGYGQILQAQGHIIIMCGNGDLALVKANPEAHQEVARIAAIAGKTWNNPAIADGKLLIRNHAEMACYDLNAK